MHIICTYLYTFRKRKRDREKKVSWRATSSIAKNDWRTMAVPKKSRFLMSSAYWFDSSDVLCTIALKGFQADSLPSFSRAKIFFSKLNVNFLGCEASVSFLIRLWCIIYNTYMYYMCDISVGLAVRSVGQWIYMRNESPGVLRGRFITITLEPIKILIQRWYIFNKIIFICILNRWPAYWRCAPNCWRYVRHVVPQDVQMLPDVMKVDVN